MFNDYLNTDNTKINSINQKNYANTNNNNNNSLFGIIQNAPPGLDYIGYISNQTLSDVPKNTHKNTHYWSLILIIFPIVTFLGNILVILSVIKEKNLRTVTNYFVVSLALADIAVATVVMPFAVYLEVVRNWGMSQTLCDAWIALDVMASTASILNLVAIAIDR